MPIPFKELTPTNIEMIGGMIPVERWGCLSRNEAIAIGQLEEKFSGKGDVVAATIAFQEEMATILIKSRIDREWSLEKTQSDEWAIEVDGKPHSIRPGFKFVRPLYEFLLSEVEAMRKGQSTDEGDAAQKKQSTGKKSTGS